MTLYGLAGSFYDIISKYRSNKANILIFIKIAIWRALVWGVISANFGVHLVGISAWEGAGDEILGL